MRPPVQVKGAAVAVKVFKGGHARVEEGNEKKRQDIPSPGERPVLVAGSVQEQCSDERSEDDCRNDSHERRRIPLHELPTPPDQDAQLLGRGLGEARDDLRIRIRIRPVPLLVRRRR
eukprot:CAMPEP_0113568544 /NCGR_PEP_ID=MMETSP0015_2-20120614/23906_1 /TAXON_ID=2838 /ORGANISM="Odontella" /LENGTH=116 /DNA_ID=CAMNT_0000471093 /DNA_START=104 /DNA_END=452 /DNA_ORIENTATION=+ /assembly_acc=CAM_ASM_000160